MQMRRAFTLLELCVVILIAVILFALLSISLSDTRGPSRRTQCSHNLRNLSLAAIQYENTHRQFPGYLMNFGTFPGSVDPSNPDASPKSLQPHRKIGTVSVALLPWLDAQPTYEHWTEDRYPIVYFDGVSQTASKNGFVELAAPNLAIFQCPQDSNIHWKVGRNSYISNNGMHHQSPSGLDSWTLTRSDGTATEVNFARSMEIANGVFNNQFAGLDPDGVPMPIGPQIGMEDFKDGQGNTVLFSESLQALPWQQAGFVDAEALRVDETAAEIRYPRKARFGQGMVWHYEDSDQINGAGTVSPVHRINGGSPLSTKMTPLNAADIARPSSAHTDGVNMSMGDGSTRFITETIDYRVYQALMTPRGKSSLVPKEDYVLDADAL
ncbi:hypothetical protein CA13_51680 [Planctomycetes bacterium CA13]|uniref:DUF1559 domain-containing protein n=1 Tax=Novipirellula herctigrandis TaxID=2527986 RepID=A0A5C5ZA76_9BACT|nr:hypothetical protein CA13_51680 [Planctomycetes bacterium CA13]